MVVVVYLLVAQVNGIGNVSQKQQDDTTADFSMSFPGHYHQGKPDYGIGDVVVKITKARRQCVHPGELPIGAIEDA